MTPIERFFATVRQCGKYVRPTIVHLMSSSEEFLWVSETPEEIAGMVADELRIFNAPAMPSPFMP